MADFGLLEATIVEGADDTRDRHRLAMQAVGLATDRHRQPAANAGGGGGAGGGRIVDGDDGVGGALADQRRQQKGAIGRRTTTDIVAGLDDNGWELAAVECLANRRVSV